MKIAWDITRSQRQTHASGLLRVARSLGLALEKECRGDFHWVRWSPWSHTWIAIDPETGRRRGSLPALKRGDWWVTSEVFTPAERRGLSAWIKNSPCFKAAVFHDLIPIRHPEFTWPRSVRRHPHYLRMLAEMDLVMPVSRTVLEDLEDWLRKNMLTVPALRPLRLGTGFSLEGSPSELAKAPSPPPPLRVLSVGIIEPRKNQSLTLNALELAWSRKLPVEAAFSGRCNPHFGKPILQRMLQLKSQGHPLRYLHPLEDSGLAAEYSRAHMTVFPSIAEGAGLPVVESLSRGTPVLATDIGSHQEYGSGGGCHFIRPDDPSALVALWESFLNRPQTLIELQAQARARTVFTWRDTARALRGILSNHQTT